MVTEYNHIDYFIPRHYTSYPRGKGECQNNEAPLQVIFAESGSSMKFRLINVGYRNHIMLGIEGRRLHVIETDGFPVERVTVDRILTFPGERYDFIIDDGSAVAYNITADMHTGPTLTKRASGKALLNVTLYRSVSNTSVNTEKLNILNCLALVIPNVECIPVSDLSAMNDSLDPSCLKLHNSFDGENLRKKTLWLVLNGQFGYQGINSFNFKFPTVSAISQPSAINHCPSSRDGERCTYSIDLHKNANITIAKEIRTFC